VTPGLTAECHISSLLVHANPARSHAVSHAIDALAGAEVRASDGAGKLVVLLETENEEQILATFRRIETLRGVLGVALVYHHADSA